MSKVLEKLARREVAFGCIDSICSPALTEVLGAAGMDMACADMMFRPTSWDTFQAIVRSAQVFGIDPFVRLKAYPWAGASDHRLAVDAALAYSLGAVGVAFSCATVEDVERIVEVSRDWHRDIHIHPFEKWEYQSYKSKVASQRVVMPLIEDAQALKDLDKILAVKGVHVVFLALSDISRMVGHPFDFGHPKVWEVVDRAVESAAKNDVAIAANVGYEFSKGPEMMAERVHAMAERGVRVVMLQNSGFLIQKLYRYVLDTIGAGLPPAQPRAAKGRTGKRLPPRR